MTTAPSGAFVRKMLALWCLPEGISVMIPISYAYILGHSMSISELTDGLHFTDSSGYRQCHDRNHGDDDSRASDYHCTKHGGRDNLSSMWSGDHQGIRSGSTCDVATSAYTG